MTKSITTNQTTTTHLFPFTFDKEGPVDAHKFLSVTPSTALTIKSGTPVDDLLRHSTVIMGRLLEGIEIKPPANCKGYVWKQETNALNDDGYDDDYQEQHSDEEEQDTPINKNSLWSRTDVKVGESFILWKKDIAPPSSDPRIHAIESWITIADMIHKPIPIKQ
ncbi:hypothetical protein BC941DRAFT_414347 [Chlamydoabsidia padenii]|nr:hypothetical protein BC941DRAFT_414347 [Chlamydoabsidia padenii]